MKCPKCGRVTAIVVLIPALDESVHSSRVSLAHWQAIVMDLKLFWCSCGTIWNPGAGTIWVKDKEGGG